MNSGFALPFYVYEPLQSIDHVRVLVLRPTAAFNDALQIDIIQYNRRGMHLTSYTTTPVYEAVSYAWGNPDFTRHIICNDTTKLSITQKVDTMLRYFRRAAKPRYLWIDAICLNQSNESEKMEQISKMGNIYREARKVNIWLGEATAIAPQILSLFAEIASLINEEDGIDIFPCSGDNFEKQNFPRKIRKHIRHKEIDTETTSRIYQLLNSDERLSSADLNEFFERPWFTRRWVLQEATLNQCTIVNCGIYKTPWSSFSSGTTALYNFENAKKSAKPYDLSYIALESISVVVRLKDRSSGLFALLWDFHLSKCREPADRIRSLYGLANSSWAIKDFKAANSTTYSWPKIYEIYARQSLLIRYQHHHQVLAHVLAFGSLSDLHPEVPSFVPNWSGSRRYTALFKSWANIEPHFPRCVTQIHFGIEPDFEEDYLDSRTRPAEFCVGKLKPLIYVHKIGVQIHWREIWRPVVDMLESLKPGDAPPKENIFRHFIGRSPKKIAKIMEAPKTPSQDPRLQALQRLFDPDLVVSFSDTKPGFLQGSQTRSIMDVEELLRWLTEPNSLRDDLQHNEWPLWIHRAFRGLHSLLERHSLLVIDDESARVVALGPSSVEA
jgi:hypothetical protein